MISVVAVTLAALCAVRALAGVYPTSDERVTWYSYSHDRSVRS